MSHRRTMDPDTALVAADPRDEGPIVLLVDDQALVGSALRQALAAHPDIRIHHCREGSAALAAALDIHPTVILQDLVMPDADGLDLVRAYRASPELGAIPIIVLSGEEQSSVKSAAFAAGANDYIVKLPDPIELTARIRYHSRSHLYQLQRDAAYRALRDSEMQLLAANLELQRLSEVDALTGLCNRRSFDERLELEWKRVSRQHTLSLMMIDVDDFKRYNDNFGHVAGDEVLRAVSGLLHSLLRRPTDFAARFGGEEFVIVLPGTALAGAALLGERMRAEVECLGIPHTHSGVSGLVTISVGVASLHPQVGQPPLRLVEAADHALYEAKRGGKNRVAVGPEPKRPQ